VDVVAISETLLYQRITDTEILDSSYVIFRQYRQQGERGGGVLLCLKSDFVCVRRRDLEMDEVETVACEISDISNFKMIIAVFYRPPNMDLGYLQQVVNISYKICRTGTKNIFILGNFNFPNVNWSSYSSSSNFDSCFIECLCDCFWCQLMNVSTRCANGSATTIDLLVISVPEYVRHIESLSGEFSSDHMLRVNAYKNGPKSPINGTSRKIDFACILSTDRS